MTTAFAFDWEPVMTRLAETIAWCEPRATLEDTKRCLRSEQLQPWLMARDRAAMVSLVAIWRAHKVRGKLRPIARHTDLRGARLLVYFPELNLDDGAAELASHGFLDAQSTPPWDTWIALGHDPALKHLSKDTYLLAWVPPIFVDLVSCGIAMYQEPCIVWLEDANINARDELRRLCR